jgi:hypothetical protein
VSDDFLVTFDHLHSVPSWGARPGFCHRGARALANRYGLDWAAIVRDGGISASALEATGDAMAIHLVAHARLMGVQHGHG